MAFVCTYMLLAYNGYHATYSAMSQIIKMDADFHQNLSSCGNFEKDFFHKFFISIQLYSESSVQYYTIGLNGVLIKTDDCEG